MSINSVTSRRPYICEISVSCQKSGMFDNCASVSKVGKPFDQKLYFRWCILHSSFLGTSIEPARVSNMLRILVDLVLDSGYHYLFLTDYLELLML